MRLPTAALALLAGTLPGLARAEAPPDLLQEIETHFHAAKKWFGMVADLEWERDASGALSPKLSTLHSNFVLATDPAGQVLGVRLPPLATGPHEVWLEGAPGLSVRTEEVGIAPVAPEVLRGVVIYRGAIAGGDLLYKLTPTHADEYLYFRTPPATLRRELDFDVGAGVGRLREAGRLIEVLAKDGTARLRLSAPVARAADGTRRTGTVRVEGSRLIEELDLRGLPAPILVDPDWSTTGTMSVAHWADQGWRRSDGRVMAVGGCALASCPLGLATSACNQVLASTDVWTKASGTWTAGPPLRTARYSYAAAELRTGELLIAGGCTATGCAAVTADAERYSDAEARWVAAGALPSPRANLTAAVLAGGDAVAAGGCDSARCFADAARYGAATNAWTSIAPLSAPRGYHTSTTLRDGRVLVLGGCGDATCATVLSDAELYDPATDSWRSAGAMSTPRAGHTASLLDDGSVLVTGGCSRQPCKDATLGSSELWQVDPARGGRFSAGPPMIAPRHHHTATRLASGQVLLAGGTDVADSTRATSEVYLPVARRFLPTPRMMMSRAYHAATALATGEVLVSGGCNAATCLPWAEVFSPAGLPAETADGGLVVLDGGVDPPEPELDAGPPFTPTGGPHPKLFRTGVFSCGTDTVQDLPCPIAGYPAQDGEFQPNTRPMVPGADEVRDTLTGLTWQAKDDGRTYAQAAAVEACAAYGTGAAPAGQWRLPTVLELATINHYGKIGPSVDQAFAPGTQQTNYWTASPVAGSQLLFWTVKFDAGEVVPLLGDTPLPMRCVRGTLAGGTPAGHLRLAGPLTAAADTVRDDLRGLEWQRRDDGQKRTWRESLDYCAHLDLGGKRDWHLPNTYELLSLVEFGSADAVKIDPAFENTQGDLYWTGTFNEGIPTLSWSVTFNLGVVDGVTYSGHALARCVRHQQPPAAKPTCGCQAGAGEALLALGLFALVTRKRRGGLTP